MDNLKRAVPVLASLNIAHTVRFYEEKLGFKKAGWIDRSYAILSRDGIELHFWHCNDKIHPENTSCYIYVAHVEELYKELFKSRVVHPNGKLEKKPWGTYEFAILDGDGNMIKFGQKL